MARASTSSHRYGFLVTAFSLLACVLLQQQVAVQGDTLGVLARLRLQRLGVTSSSASSATSVRVVKVQKSSATTLHGAAGKVSPRRHGTGALVVTPTSQAPKTAIKAGCGDGLVTGAEKCDDHNTTNNDGCSSSCVIETGFACSSGQPSTCWATCGDGVLAATERCDDGNLTGGDGCTGTCKVEFGFQCSGSPSKCEVPAFCGDGVVSGKEECDDGNSHGGDGCSATCTTES